MKLNEFMSLRAAAEYLGIRPYTLHAWTKKDKIKYYVNPANNHRLFKKEDLDEFLGNIMSSEEINSTNEIILVDNIWK